MTTEFLRTSATVAASAVVLAFAGVLTAEPRVAGPSEHVYRVAGSRQLRLFLFSPAEAPPPGSRRAVILLFHGGGWHVGEPSWMFASAKRYAAGGMVAAAVEYRLSDQTTVTPIEAMDDARWAVRWIREHANELHLDPARVAAGGVSAGAHLAAATAVIPAPEVGDAAVPNALVLTSPAVSLANDGWFRRLLLGRVDPVVLSPDQQVRTAPPPAILFVGADDTVTPVPGAERFCEAARRAGGRCDVHVYPGVGHLFTRHLDPRAQEAGPFDPAPDVQADVRARTEAFLMRSDISPVGSSSLSSALRAGSPPGRHAARPAGDMALAPHPCEELDAREIGLPLVSFEDYYDAETPPVGRFRAVYRRV